MSHLECLTRLRRNDAVPEIFFTNTGYEYWGRTAALIHTSLNGSRDIELGPEVRSYHFSSTQHFVGPFPPRFEGTRYPGNSVDFLWSLRALLLAMDRWITDDVAPPPSRVPRLDDGTLVALEDYRFPAIPGIEAPKIAHNTWRLDFGPRFRSEGIVDHQPPRVGAPFPVLVPQVDADGNETAGIRLPQIGTSRGQSSEDSALKRPESTRIIRLLINARFPVRYVYVYVLEHTPASSRKVHTSSKRCSRCTYLSCGTHQ